MRSFYTDANNRTADLCLMLNSEETRLTVRDHSGNVINRECYPTWTAAVDALRATGSTWTNDLTNGTICPA